MCGLAVWQRGGQSDETGSQRSDDDERWVIVREDQEKEPGSVPGDLTLERSLAVVAARP
jgi:hypothetical protein